MNDGVDDWKVIEGKYPGFNYSFSYNKIPEPKHCFNYSITPIEYINSFFTVNLSELFFKETNQYAYQLHKYAQVNISCRVETWKLITTSELKNF